MHASVFVEVGHEIVGGLPLIFSGHSPAWGGGREGQAQLLRGRHQVAEEMGFGNRGSLCPCQWSWEVSLLTGCEFPCHNGDEND